MSWCTPAKAQRLSVDIACAAAATAAVVEADAADATTGSLAGRGVENLDQSTTGTRERFGMCRIPPAGNPSLARSGRTSVGLLPHSESAVSYLAGRVFIIQNCVVVQLRSWIGVKM